MKTNMHYNASTSLFRNAQHLRNKQTYAEKLLLSGLRNNQLGVHFRRQHPVDKYVVDFYCQQFFFAVEVDGEIHSDKTVMMEDKQKESDLKALGFVISRYTNDQVIKKIDDVVNSIKRTISFLSKKGPL